MRSPPLPLCGACRCGQVHIEITAPPLMTAVCHCSGCKVMSSSAFTLTAMIPAQGFAVTQGAPVIGGLHGSDLHHYFCPHCMTWMFTRLEQTEAFVNVRPTMFPDHAWFSPFIETMTAEKLDWVETPARYKYEGFPPMEDLDRLIAEFAAVQQP